MLPTRSSTDLKVADSRASLSLAPIPAIRPEARSPVTLRAASVFWYLSQPVADIDQTTINERGREELQAGDPGRRPPAPAIGRRWVSDSVFLVLQTGLRIKFHTDKTCVRRRQNNTDLTSNSGFLAAEVT